MHFLTLITRCKDEPYMEEFVKYYISEGVERIHILDDNSIIPFSKYVLEHPNVKIHKSNGNFKKDQMEDAQKLYSRIRNKSKWFIFVDCDEFITTRKNLNNTIVDELKTKFKNADCIKVPWIMMSCNGIENDPNSLLEDLTYRWNHDLKHIHPNNWVKGRCRYDKIEVKCIFKGKKFNNLSMHIPLEPIGDINCVNSINCNKSIVSFFYNNLREKDINVARLICHHYRIISKESCLRKIKTSNLSGYNCDVENLLICDYPEIIDETLKIKFINKIKKVEN